MLLFDVLEKRGISKASLLGPANTLVIVLMLTVCSACSEDLKNSVSEYIDQLPALAELGEELEVGLKHGRIELFIRDEFILELTLVNSEYSEFGGAELEKEIERIIGTVQRYKENHEELTLLRILAVNLKTVKRKYLVVKYMTTVGSVKFWLNDMLDSVNGPCAEIDVDKFTGEWYGNHFLERKGFTQIWRNHRRKDGTFTLTFYEEDGDTVANVQSGEWSTDGCMLTEHVTKLDNEVVSIKEPYLVNKLTDDAVQYTSFSSETTYNMKKVTSE